METKSTTSSDQSKVTTLVERIKHTPEGDFRRCPHEGCDGRLKLTKDETQVVCSSCRCTPNGIYLSPPKLTKSPPYLSSRFYLPNPNLTDDITYLASRSDPESIWGDKTIADGWKHHFRRGHDTYDNRYGDVARLAGGYEAVYDRDERGRPHGVDDSYTWDLSSSNYEKVNTGHEWTSG